MTTRLEDRIGALGRVERSAADRVAARARERMGSPPAPGRAGRWTARRELRRGAAVAGALLLALAGILLLVARPWGEPANAAILRRAWIAVTPPPHSVEHIAQVQRQGSSVIATESWQSIDDPGSLRWRQTSSSCGDWVTDISSTLTQQQWFDPDHDRVLRSPLVPAEVRASWPADGPRVEFDPTVSFAAAVQRGEAHVGGHTAIDGTPVTQITWAADPVRDPGSLNILYVATATGVPVAYDWGGGKLDATGGVVAHQRFSVYEFLPESAATARALSVSAAHPGAALSPITNARSFGLAYQAGERKHCGSAG